jgi:hypothetical protein
MSLIPACNFPACRTVSYCRTEWERSPIGVAAHVIALGHLPSKLHRPSLAFSIRTIEFYHLSFCHSQISRVAFVRSLCDYNQVSRVDYHIHARFSLRHSHLSRYPTVKVFGKGLASALTCTIGSSSTWRKRRTSSFLKHRLFQLFPSMRPLKTPFWAAFAPETKPNPRSVYHQNCPWIKKAAHSAFPRTAS